MFEVQVRTGITDADLLRLDPDKRIEVVNGEFVEQTMAAGFLHVFCGDNLFRILDPHVRANKLGVVLTDGLHFKLKADAQGIKGARIPDIAFIRRGRIPKDFDWSLPFPGAPDLAVEVVSPGNKPDDILGRIEDYLDAGTEEVWVMYPESRLIYRYQRSDRSLIRVYHEADTLDAAPLLPDLTIVMADLFKIDDL